VDTVLRGQLALLEPSVTDATAEVPRSVVDGWGTGMDMGMGTADGRRVRTRLLYDVEFTDNEDRKMAALGLRHNSLLALEDTGQDLRLQMHLVAARSRRACP
jgi:hypothetical protein